MQGKLSGLHCTSKYLYEKASLQQGEKYRYAQQKKKTESGGLMKEPRVGGELVNL